MPTTFSFFFFFCRRAPSVNFTPPRFVYNRVSHPKTHQIKNLALAVVPYRSNENHPPMTMIRWGRRHTHTYTHTGSKNAATTRDRRRSKTDSGDSGSLHGGELSPHHTPDSGAIGRTREGGERERRGNVIRLGYRLVYLIYTCAYDHAGWCRLIVCDKRGWLRCWQFFEKVIYCFKVAVHCAIDECLDERKENLKIALVILERLKFKLIKWVHLTYHLEYMLANSEEE